MPVSFPPSILVSTSRVVLEPSRETAGRAPRLQAGRVLTAEVLRVLSERSAELLIDGRKMTAKTFLPLAAGQRLLLRVEQGGARQMLTFLGEADSAADVPRALVRQLQTHAAAQKMLTRIIADTAGGHAALLKDTVAAGSLQSEIPAPDMLGRLIRNSGLLWEAKLAALADQNRAPSPAVVERFVSSDLKGVLLHMLSGGETGAFEAAAGPLKAVLNGLEQQQMANHLLMDTMGRCILPVPVHWGGTISFGQMLIDFGKDQAEERSKEERVFTVSFLLSLSRVGDLRADVSVLNNGVTGMFGVAEEWVRQEVTAQLPELRRRLQAHGFTVYDIGCKVLPPESLSEATLFSQAAVPSGDRLLNLVI